MNTPTVLDRARKIDIVTSPFPHLRIENALPDEFYNDLQNSLPHINPANLPSKTQLNRSFEISSSSIFLQDQFSMVLKYFFNQHTLPSFYHQVIDLWGDIIRSLYPQIETQLGGKLEELTVDYRQPGEETNPENFKFDFLMDCNLEFASPALNPQSHFAHILRPYKLWSGYLFVPLSHDASPGGELILYRFRNPEIRPDPLAPVDPNAVDAIQVKNLSQVPLGLLEPAVTLPYTANTFVMWINSPYSLIRTAPRKMTPFMRRAIGFLSESYRNNSAGFFRHWTSRRLQPKLEKSH